jgi:hypothetical protein
MDDWKPDFNKLRNYKIEESKFENPDFEIFTNCIFAAKNKGDIIEEDVDRCHLHLPLSYKVESGGDMRCSGKSEILHLMFPMLRHNVEFSMEEERGPISSKVANFTEPDSNKLVIYVKRNPEEKLKCLLRYRSIFRDNIGREPAYYDPLPNDLRDESYDDTNNMRKTMLPSIYEHKNFIILENQNKEKEPIITNEKICKISKGQLEHLKKEVKRDVESDKRMIEKGLKEMILTRGKENYEISVRNTESALKYNKEYENICNTSKDISEIREIIDERKMLRSH